MGTETSERGAAPGGSSVGGPMSRSTLRPVAATDAIRIAAAAGLLAGFVEVGLLGVAKFALGRFTHLTPQIVWLAPLFYATLLTLLTGLLIGAARLFRRMPLLELTLAVCAFVGTFGALMLMHSLHRAAALVLATGVAYQVAFRLGRHPGFVKRAARFALPVLAVLTTGAAIGLNGTQVVRERLGLAALPAAKPGAPNILLIIWDTVRAANLSLYGYERATTPTLERLAAEGAVVFDHAISTAPWTLPAHASMFTGLWPQELAADWEAPMDRDPPTVAEVLRRNGYRTGGFIANRFYVSRESGLARGFLRYEVFPVFSLIDFAGATTIGRSIVNDRKWRLALGMLQKPGRKYADEVNEEFLAWLDEGPDRPFFAFLNVFDAHHPYLPPTPYDTLFGPLLPGRDPSMAEGRSFTVRELQAEIDAYDGGIRHQDDQLGRLLEALEERGALENTIVIVASDHGEEFGEHDVFTHGNSLYHPSLHVPLLIWRQGGVGDGARVRTAVSVRDIAATILGLAGADRGPRVAGESLARYWDGSPQPALPDTLLAEVRYARGHADDYPVSKGDMATILVEPLKYIRNGDGSEELYDLLADPDEQRDLSDTAGLRATIERLHAHLRRTTAQRGSTFARSDGDR